MNIKLVKTNPSSLYYIHIVQYYKYRLIYLYISKYFTELACQENSYKNKNKQEYSKVV